MSLLRLEAESLRLLQLKKLNCKWQVPSRLLYPFWVSEELSGLKKLTGCPVVHSRSNFLSPMPWFLGWRQFQQRLKGQ